MVIVLWGNRIFLLLSLAICATTLSAQVDPAELVRRALTLERAAAERELRFAFRERVLQKDLDGSGNVQKSTEKVHDVLMIEGSPQRLLLEENGKIVDFDELAGQQNFLRKVVDIRRNETPAERKKRMEAYEKKRAQFREALEEIPHAFQFQLTGEESR